MLPRSKEPILIPQDIEQELEAEEIINRKNSKEGLMYMVKWRGLTLKQSTWLPLNRLLNYMDLVKAYERRKLEEANRAKKFNHLPWSRHNQYERMHGGHKRIFKEHRIFQKPVKDQSKKQAPAKNCLKIAKDVPDFKVDAKLSAQTRQLQKEDFCVQIYQQSPNIFQIGKEKFPGNTNNNMQQCIDQVMEIRLQGPIETCIPANNFQVRICEIIQQMHHNLHELEREQRLNMALDNLNPHQNPNRPSSSRKYVRSEQLPYPVTLLDPRHPLLLHPEARITLMVETHGMWHAQFHAGTHRLGHVPLTCLKGQHVQQILAYLSAP